MILSLKKTLQMSTSILIQKYAERHFLKSFKKKYKTARHKTYNAISLMIERVDKFLKTTLIEEIISYDDSSILKIEFSIAWSKISPHASWNRAIIHRDKKTSKFDVLLIYMKTHIPKNKWETKRRKDIVKKEYKDTFDICWKL